MRSLRFPVAAASLILAALLAAAAAVRERGAAPLPAVRAELTVVCVRDLSWDRVIPLRLERRLPFLNSLFLEKGSWGGILSEGFGSRTAILASLMTGRWPQKHLILEQGDVGRRGTVPRFQAPVWQSLAAGGQGCAVIGFPLVFAREKRANLVLPAPPGGRDAVPERYFRLVAREAEPPGELEAFLRECLAADLQVLSRASLTGPSTPHLFVYFEGLGRWGERLQSGADGLDEETREALLDGYYVFTDMLLGKLLAPRAARGDMFLISEKGNLAGRPAFRRYFPKLEEYPPIGFFFAAGRDFRRGQVPLLVNPVDLAPTLLYLAGRPVLNNQDGRVIFSLLEEDYYFRNQLIYR